MNYPRIGTPSQSQRRLTCCGATLRMNYPTIGTPKVGNSRTARQARPPPNTLKRPVSGEESSTESKEMDLESNSERKRKRGEEENDEEDDDA